MGDKTDTCQHKHGGAVPGIPGWVCGQCWTILAERPKRYGMVNVALGGDPGSAPRQRQEIIWQAEERRTSAGMTLGAFLIIIAQRFAVKGRVDRAGSMELAIGAMRALLDLGPEFEFADPRSEWSREAAIEIADEEMSYWDQDDGDANDR